MSQINIAEGHYFRLGVSPGAAPKLTKINTEVDIINILSYIRVPTLLMQRTNDIDMKIEEGEFISQRIMDSGFVEFDGADHFRSSKIMLSECLRLLTIKSNG